MTPPPPNNFDMHICHLLHLQVIMKQTQINLQSYNLSFHISLKRELCALDAEV